MGKRILIVEDEIIVAENIRERCQSFGYDVVGVEARGEDGVKAAGIESPDLVLMDIKLRGSMDGIEAAEEIRENYNIPVLYLTSYSDDHTIMRAKNTAPYGYVLKPFRDKELYSNIEMALYKHEIEQKLQKSEERYRRLSELMSDYAYLVTIGKEDDCTVNWITEAFYRMTGYEMHTPESCDIFNRIVYPEDRAIYQRFMKRLFESGQATGEYRIVTRNGEVFWIRNQAKVTGGPSDSSTIILGAVKNITELKRIEEKLRSNEYKYELLIKSMGDGLVVVDEDDLVIFANDAFTRHTGISLDSILGRGIEVVLKAYDLIEGKGKSFNRDETYSYEVVRERKNRALNLLVNSIPIIESRIEDGYRGRIITITDVTAIKSSEKALVRKAEEYRKMFQLMPVSALIADRKGIILDVSDDFLNETEYQREQLIGRQLLQLANWGSLEDLNALLASFKENTIGFPKEMQIRIANGSIKDYRVFSKHLEELGEREILIVFYPVPL
jgi:two-component system, response regulator PdtaR